MNPPYKKTQDDHEAGPNQTPTGDAEAGGKRQKDDKKPNVDDLVIKQIEAWQMDTEVEAFIHSSGRKGSRPGN
jgi:hypothetical protein